MPRCARLVGYAMASCQDPTVPCHRVVDRFGGTKAAFDTFAPGTQRALLEAEGVDFRLDGTVDLEHCLWSPQTWNRREASASLLSCPLTAAGCCRPGCQDPAARWTGSGRRA